MRLEKFYTQLDSTRDVHIPLPIDESETNERRLEGKKVLESREIASMESLDGWESVTPWAKVELSDARSFDGRHSVLFTHPTNLETWPAHKGRIYAVPSALYRVEHENWNDWNRLSAWVYPVADGMKSITLRLQLHNEGERAVPDVYERDGAHNVTLKNRQWNHIVLEMPYLNREDVTGVSFDYDMVGHEYDAVDNVSWYLDKLELQKVEADVYESWTPMKNKISFSGSGYQQGSVKVAIISAPEPRTFKLMELESGKVVLEKEIIDVETPFAPMRVLDFSEVMEKGEYVLIAGDITSRAFSIDDNVWEISIWKTLNFFLALRCGCEVPGKHHACHSDMYLVHNSQEIVCNGGWHDAGDLAQGMYNTAEATSALLKLAEALKGKNTRLYERVLEEAKWGLDYVLKTRFEDGWRNGYSSCSIWTDGVRGTADDITSEAVKSAYINFDCAYAEALGYSVFMQSDPAYAAHCLSIAKKDMLYGIKFREELLSRDTKTRQWPPEFFYMDYVELQVVSMGAMAGAEIFRACGEKQYEAAARGYIGDVIACQRQELTDWDVPMVGFFYEDRQRDVIWHHNHMAYSCMPDIALKSMLEVFPEDASYMLWYRALTLSSEYYKAIARYTKPYGVVPAGVYHENELEEHTDKVRANLMQVIEEDYYKYKIMVRKGIPLGKGYYLRVYPVWFSFRGNYNVMLCESKSMSQAALVRNDYELYTDSQACYEWIVGKNPFAQSTMYGEGYDYVQLYAVQPGQSVGALSVGMQSKFENDIPYWPQVNTATYKEVWVCPATKWAWCMADNYTAARLSGYLKGEGSEVVLRHEATGRVFTAPVHPRSGYFEATLPAGRYSISFGEAKRNITVISGRDYVFDGELRDIRASLEQDGQKVRITVDIRARESFTLRIRACGLADADKLLEVRPENGHAKAVFESTLAGGAPFVCLISEAGHEDDSVEVLDARLAK